VWWLRISLNNGASWWACCKHLLVFSINSADNLSINYVLSDYSFPLTTAQVYKQAGILVAKVTTGGFVLDFSRPCLWSDFAVTADWQAHANCSLVLIILSSVTGILINVLVS